MGVPIVGVALNEAARFYCGQLTGARVCVSEVPKTWNEPHQVPRARWMISSPSLSFARLRFPLVNLSRLIDRTILSAGPGRPTTRFPQKLSTFFQASILFYFFTNRETLSHSLVPSTRGIVISFGWSHIHSQSQKDPNLLNAFWTLSLQRGPSLLSVKRTPSNVVKQL
jgi:hypothetical protein